MIEGFIAKKSAGVRTIEMKWRRAWDASSSAGVKVDDFVFLADLGVEPESLVYLSSCIALNDASDAKGLSARILQPAADESPYAIKDWGGAINRLARQLLEEGIKTEIRQFMGYLACAAEFAASETVRMPFEDLVGEMYEQYGFFTE
ncbi:MAG: hypothetical protein AAGB46_11105 [Verrucomicrobiota bacterium]